MKNFQDHTFCTRKTLHRTLILEGKKLFSSNNLGETIRSDLLKFGVLNTFYNLNLSCKSLENEEPTVGGVPILDERNTNVGIKKKSERIPLQW